MAQHKNGAAIESLKKVLLQENKTLNLHALFLGMNLDFSHATVIFAGNLDMDDSALKERVLPMRFPNMEPANKRAILDRELEVLTSDLPKDRRRAIRERAELNCQLIMELDAVQPGARKIKEVAGSLIGQLREDYTMKRSYDADFIVEYVHSLYASATEEI